MTSFSYNKETAKQESFSSGPINKTGDYLGRITQAWEHKNPNTGSVSLVVNLVSDQGATLTQYINHVTSTGETNERGVITINSIMSALSLRSLNPKNGVIQKWNKEAKSMQDVKATIYPAVIDKHIGFVVQMSEVLKQVQDVTGKWVNSPTGETREEASVIAYFDADTRMTASEKASGMPTALIIDELVDSLPPVKMLLGSRGAQIVAQAENRAPTTTNTAPIDFDDDMDALPF